MVMHRMVQGKLKRIPFASITFILNFDSMEKRDDFIESKEYQEIFSLLSKHVKNAKYEAFSN